MDPSEYTLKAAFRKASCLITLCLSTAHGRYLLPVTQLEKALDTSPQITTFQRRVFFNPNEVASSTSRIIKGEDVALAEAELRDVRGNDEWIYYKVWEMKDEFLEDRRGRGVDVLYVHGKCCCLCWPEPEEYS